VLLPHDYLNYRLTGRRVTDRGDASGTGYFDPSSGTWLPDLLDQVVGPADWTERLPDVLGPSESVGPLGPEGAVGLDIGDVGVVGPGTGDNMAARSPIRPARWRDSPTPPVATCPWCARSTPPG
jgi:xylulokinase